MRHAAAIILTLFLALACGGKQGASFIPGDEQRQESDRKAVEDGRTETGGGADAGKTCGECPEDRTCSPEGVCVPWQCNSSKDCPGDLVCAQALGICVRCVGAEDCAEGLFCGADHECHLTYPCTSDKQCKDKGMVCDKEAGVCVECLTGAECGKDEYCDAGFCLPALCTPGETKCVGNEVRGCPDGKAWGVAQTCTDKQYCEDAVCKDLVCDPGQVWCEGEVYKVCSQDGKSVQYQEDCAAEKKHCFAGACIEAICMANQKFCLDGDTAATCAEDGLSYAAENCPGQHFCNSADGTCLPWACTPGQAVCAGSVVTVCDAIGSGIASQTDCIALGKQCSGGQCKDCQSQCDGKKCGEDGCGGACGTCAETETCQGGLCVPNAPDCPADKDCTGLQCGPDPVCGESCGECTPPKACQDGQCSGCQPVPGMKTFEFTGKVEYFVVPDCVTQVAIEAWGAQGGNAEKGYYCSKGYGGLGGYASCALAVQPGESLSVRVGGAQICSDAQGWNGGGQPGGGGASDVRRAGDSFSDRVVVAAGGGAGFWWIPGGQGGGLVGGAGEPGETPSGSGVGFGGTQNSGGESEDCVPGVFGGGGGAPDDVHSGGGGGWYGGGCGWKAGAGGGSSHFGGCIDGSTEAGVNTGNGKIILNW